MSSDVRDILSIEDTGVKKQNLLDKDALLNNTDKKAVKKTENPKRPRNIPRELWGLKDTFGGDFPSILPAPEVQIYKQPKAQITGKVRSWLWTGFKNSARNDDLTLKHWKRADQIEKEHDYYFAQFNKKPVLPMYTGTEYEHHLDIEEWSREETDYLMEMADKFNMRFIVIHDRWDRSRFKTVRSIEDLKERYYMVLNTLNTIRADQKPCTDAQYGPGNGWGVDTSCLVFHADHERRRKRQLERLMARTPDQIAEEERLAKALHRIEILKRERQKKTMDLHKLLSQADFAIRSTGAGLVDMEDGVGGSGGGGTGSSMAIGGGSQGPSSAVMAAATTAAAAAAIASVACGSSGSMGLTGSGAGGSGSRKKTSIGGGSILQTVGGTVVWEGLKFPDLSKNAGVHLRSAEMKLPATIGIKKTRFIEGLLNYFQIDPNPVPTDDIVDVFNNLRGDILLIQELYATLSHLEYELCSYREKYKKLVESGIQIEYNKSVPTCLSTPHIPFASSPSLRLGLGLQAAIRAAEVKQKPPSAAAAAVSFATTVVSQTIVNQHQQHHGGRHASPPETRSSCSDSVSSVVPTHHRHTGGGGSSASHHQSGPRKRRHRTHHGGHGDSEPDDDNFSSSEASGHRSRKSSVKRFRVAAPEGYVLKKRP